jgi:hypothetical protein
VTNVFATPFTIAPLAPAASAPASSGGSGPGLGARIDVDWSDTRTDRQAADQQARKSSIKKARAAVEKDWNRPSQTKAQRLAAAASKGTRFNGSLQERRSTLGSVQKAMAAVEGIPSDTELSAPEARAVREVLRQRYPGRKLSEMIATAEQLDQALKADPASGYDTLMSHYGHGMLAENLPVFRAREYSEGLRGSLERAREDQSDSEDLAAASTKYGKGLNQILAQIEIFDRGMLENPGFTAARLAVAAGAPATEREIPAYKASRAAKEQFQKRSDDMFRGIQMAKEHGLLPDFDKPEVSAAILAVMKHPDFRHHPTDGLATIRHAHHVALQLVRNEGTGKRDAGSRSIGGGSPGAGHSTPKRNQGGVRASIQKAMEA